MFWEPEWEKLKQLLGLFHDFMHAGSNNEIYQNVQKVIAYR
jgi:hypothetical protein